MTANGSTGLTRRGLLAAFAATAVTAAPTYSNAFGILRGGGDIRSLHHRTTTANHPLEKLCRRPLHILRRANAVDRGHACRVSTSTRLDSTGADRLSSGPAHCWLTCRVGLESPSLDRLGVESSSGLRLFPERTATGSEGEQSYP